MLQRTVGSTLRANTDEVVQSKSASLQIPDSFVLHDDSTCLVANTKAHFQLVLHKTHVLALVRNVLTGDAGPLEVFHLLLIKAPFRALRGDGCHFWQHSIVANARLTVHPMAARK